MFLLVGRGKGVSALENRGRGYGRQERGLGGRQAGGLKGSWLACASVSTGNGRKQNRNARGKGRRDSSPPPLASLFCSTPITSGNVQKIAAKLKLGENVT